MPLEATVKNKMEVGANWFKINMHKSYFSFLKKPCCKVEEKRYECLMRHGTKRYAKVVQPGRNQRGRGYWEVYYTSP